MNIDSIFFDREKVMYKCLHGEHISTHV